MTFGAFLNQWWNLPYLVMLGLVAVFFIVHAAGMLAHGGDGEADAAAAGIDGGDAGGEPDLDGDAAPDHDFGTEHDGSLDHDVSSDQDVSPDHDVSHDQDADDSSGAGHVHSLGAFLGVGRVPFMVIWLTLFIFAGFTGLFVNRVLQVRSGGYRPWFFPGSLAAALAVGVLSVRLAARAVSRLVDLGGRGSSTRRELAGAIGVVASPVLDDKFGEVRVHDAMGNELIVHGHLSAPERALKQGDRVVLLELETGSGLFQVAALKE